MKKLVTKYGKLVVKNGRLTTCCPPCGDLSFDFFCTDGYRVRSAMTVTIGFGGVERDFSVVFGALETNPDHWWADLTGGVDSGGWRPCGEGSVFRVQFLEFYCLAGELWLAVGGRNSREEFVTSFATNIHGMLVETVVSNNPINLIFEAQEIAGYGVDPCEEDGSTILTGRLRF